MKNLNEKTNAENPSGWSSDPPASPADEPPAAPPPNAAKRNNHRMKAGLTILVLAGCATVVFFYYLGARMFEKTDDAFIEGHIVQLSPRVPGIVLKVRVQDNQDVKEGDLLVEIDPRDYEVRLEQARAALEAAMAHQREAKTNISLTSTTTNAGITQASSGVDTAHSAIAAAEAAVAAARSQLDQARAQVKAKEAQALADHADAVAAEAEATRTGEDLKRFTSLYESRVASLQELQSAEAAAKSGAANVVSKQKKALASDAETVQARAAEKMAAEDLRRTQSQLEGTHSLAETARGRLAEVNVEPERMAVSRNQLETAAADVKGLEAAAHEAELNLSYTRITAPAAGRITRKAVEDGSYVQAGQPLMALVPKEVWVIANYKETQLTRMRPGQPVEIRVDTYPGRVFPGRVDSIQWGTGARFSLLPPENATGNYVKVVQRVPVKIVFDDAPFDTFVLGPGMSVTPKVKVR